MTIRNVGVFTVLMQFSNIKIIKKINEAKALSIKTVIFMCLTAYWGVILIGTFVTFN